MPDGAYRSPIMSLAIDLGVGAGLATASGARPFLPPLVVGGLASADAGIDFDGTDFAFLEHPAFLAAVFAAAVLWYVLRRRALAADAGPGRTLSGTVNLSDLAPPEGKWAYWLESFMAVALGSLLFAGALEDGGTEGAIGLFAGFGCGALGFVAMQTLFSGAGRRLEEDGDTATALTVARDLLAVAIAVLSVFVPFFGYAALLAFAVYLTAATRQRKLKYKGLRILK
jgi:hypothetical protein